MNEVTKLLICIQPLLDASTYRHIQIISKALLIMTGRIIMLSISRWGHNRDVYDFMRLAQSIQTNFLFQSFDLPEKRKEKRGHI